MSDEAGPSARHSGVGRPIAAFVRNRVAGHLLMVLALGGGLLVASNLTVTANPALDPRQVVVTVQFPGSSPIEVEQSVTRRIEERIVGLEGAHRVTSYASSEVGSVVVDVDPFAVTADVLKDVRSAVERIEGFPPPGAKPPEVAVPSLQSRSVTVAVASAKLTRLGLRAAAEQVREDLLALPSVSTVVLDWTSPREIAIDVSEEALREHGLSIADVADRLGRSSIDLTSGQLLTSAGGLVLRVDDRRTRAEEFEDIVLLAQSTGELVTLADIAEVREGLAEPSGDTELEGVPAIFVSVLTSPADESKLVINRDVDAMLADYVAPPGAEVSAWMDHSQYAASQLNLVRNTGILALALVFVVLALVFDFRLAMWVAVGLPVSFLGALAFFPAFDLTINVATLYALVIMIGILVDDAIVVGESVARQRELGLTGAEAAVAGAQQVFWPVVVGVATTFLAFVPLLFAQGAVGQFLGILPVVIGLVLAVSLIEAFLILPSHLAASGEWSRWPLQPVRAEIGERLERLRDGVAVPAIAAATRRPATTLAVAAVLLVGSFALLFGGAVRQGDLSIPAGSSIEARLTYPVGTPFDQARAGVRQLEAAARRIHDQFDVSPIESVATVVGHHESPGGIIGDARAGSHLAQVVVVLRHPSARSASMAETERAWRRNVGQVVGAEGLTFTTADSYHDVAITLVHPDAEALRSAAADIASAMQAAPGTFGVSDSQVPGRRHFVLELTQAGQAAGLTATDLAGQLRTRFFGAEVQRIQRGREEVKVMVRYPEDRRRSLNDLADERIELPDEGGMALALAARTVETRHFETLMRIDGLPAIEVGAQVDSAVATASQIRSHILQDVLPDLAARYPGLAVGREVAGADTGASLETLKVTLPIMLLAMYILMAVQFRSYVQPFIILTGMPLAAGGAILAHFVLDYDFSLPSAFGIVAVLGVVINDTLLLVDRYNSLKSPAVPAIAAMGGAVRQRFRPIFLTTVTTVVGLLPVLYLESETVASVFEPMVVSIIGGLVAGSAGILFVVPAIVLIGEGIRERMASPERRAAPA